jgi:hypothetical protein
MSAGEINIEERISIIRIKYFFETMNIENEEHR